MNSIVQIKQGIQARAYAGEIAGGADVLEYLGGIVVASILIAAAIIFGKLMRDTINNTGNNVSSWFNTTTNSAINSGNH